jgi:SPX domain protein involved in polyphosphate accumulation
MLWLEAETVLKKLILRQMAKDYEISLTQEELELLKKYVNEGEDFVNVTDEHIRKVYTSIIDKADELQEQLDAYDESTPDLLVWFYNKYNEK